MSHRPERPLLTERLRRLAAPVGILLVALMVVTLSTRFPRGWAVLIVVGTVALLVALRARTSRRDGDGAQGSDGYGPGAG